MLCYYFQILILILFYSVTPQQGAPTVQDLGGQWQLTNGDIEIANATVPGGVFSDLMNGGVLDDIFFERQDTESRWVGESNWTYSQTFIVDENLLSYEAVVLIFEGLDTFATVSINGAQVGSTDNMFKRYSFNVKELLQVGENEIVVQFASPVAQALALAEDPSNQYVPDSTERPMDVRYRSIRSPLVQGLKVDVIWTFIHGRPMYDYKVCFMDIHLLSNISSFVHGLKMNM